MIWRSNARCHQFVLILRQCLGYVADGEGDILSVALFEPLFTRVLIGTKLLVLLLGIELTNNIEFTLLYINF